MQSQDLKRRKSWSFNAGFDSEFHEVLCRGKSGEDEFGIRIERRESWKWEGRAQDRPVLPRIPFNCHQIGHGNCFDDFRSSYESRPENNALDTAAVLLQ